MKTISKLALALAMVVLFAKPVFANHEHPREKGAQAAQGETAEPVEDRNTDEGMMQYSLKNMQSQMAEIHQTEDLQKRTALLQEHNKSMRDSITMLREMMGDMAMGSGPVMGGGKAGKMCDHKKDHHSAHHSGSNASAAPVALDQITTDQTPTNPAKKLWVCPMHPEVAQDHPGVCPKCGMDLVEMQQSGASQPGHRHMMGSGMKCNNMKGGGKKNCCKKGDCKNSGMKGDGTKCGSSKGGCAKCQMMEKRMDMILLLMEQMLEHNEAAMVVPK